MKLNVLAIAFCVLAITSCKKDRQTDVMQPNTWHTMTVKAAETQVSQLYSATIQGRQDIEIRPQVQGKITEVCVTEGQQVKRGQLLFVIDPVPYRAALAQATAQVSAAQAQLATARLNYESRKRLFDQKVVSAHDLQTVFNTLSDAKAQLALAKAAEMSVRNNLSYTHVVSPANGVVGTIPFRQGALVGPETSQALTTISDNSEMYVYFSMDENQLLTLLRKYGSTAEAVAKMDSVELQLSDGGMYDRKGRISSISGVINRSTGSVSLRADFHNPKRLLHSGATGNVKITTDIKNALLVPQSATVTLQDKIVVYKVVKGKAVSTEIHINPSNDGRNYIVTDGLSAGDVIISDGAGMVQDGMEIK